jgi:hypothetical protein
MSRGVADVAVISVISSGVVGVLGAATGLYGQSLTFVTERDKRREARRDDLRSVLDQAAEAVTMFQKAFSRDQEPKVGEIAQSVQGVLPELSRCHARIGVRVGTESAVFKSYENLADGFARLHVCLAELRQDVTFVELDAETDAYRAGSAALTEAKKLTDTFLNTAAKVVGAPLAAGRD